MQGLHALMSGALTAHQDVTQAGGAADMLRHTGWIKAWQKSPQQTDSSERDMLANRPAPIDLAAFSPSRFN
jgi:hypothetical protein